MMNYFIFFGQREITWEQEQFSEENSECFARCHASLISKMALGVASHQFRGVKQLNTENKLRQIQNIPVHQEKDFSKMKAFMSEKFFRKTAQEGSALGLLSGGKVEEP